MTTSSRFALLEHDHPTLHWDLMLQVGDVLWTWRLPSPPSPGIDQLAARIPDHRLVYLDYEGPVSGNRGRVVCWDRGTCDWRERAADRHVVALEGQRLHGTLTLTWEQGAVWRAAFVPA